MVGSSLISTLVKWNILDKDSAYLVDVFIFESPWATESSSEVLIKRVCAPKDSSSTFKLHIVAGCRVAFPAAIQTDGKHQM